MYNHYSLILNNKALSKKEKQLEIEKFWLEFQKHSNELESNNTLNKIGINNIIFKVNETFELKKKILIIKYER